ncbi:glycosyltransferase family protein [Pseudomonas viciae]|uniref:capsule biosynthesis protein n=1 Tax=Pseudomonas viciae TaxID=2505979 RepID=UPI002234E2A3|nr:capsule biosynthesis protein [Pseudomonas viciae]UZE86988.1 capsule biosynthesis protein [Pseudomonas viciae]
MSALSPDDSGVQAVGCWAQKARELDRYRWKLLRERHGRCGSLLRLVRDVLVDVVVGIRTKACLSGSVVTTPCEVLLLHSAPKSMALQRKNILIDSLRKRGHHLAEAALRSPSDACALRMLLAPPQSVPLRYLVYAAHAQWLVMTYQPKVLINERNGSLHAPFLRLALAARGARLLHLAHAATLESSRRLAMNDFDYYGVFGRSSLVALQERTLRFGESTVVLVGSYLADETYDLPPADPALQTLLILGVGPDREKEPGYQRTYQMLCNWAGQHPHYRVLFKRHPRSKAQFWSDAALQFTNIELLDIKCSLAQALAQSSVVVNIMSNAGIEAGLAGRPVIHVNAGSDVDVFSHSLFFGPQVRNEQALSRQLQMLEQDYQGQVAQARRFADYHLVHGSQGLAKTTQLVENLLRGEDPRRDFETIRLPAVG